MSLKDVFMAVDTENDGTITAKKLQRGLDAGFKKATHTYAYEGLTDQDLKKLIEPADLESFNQVTNKTN